jgi:vacuolar protein sorting-associated protein 35
VTTILKFVRECTCTSILTIINIIYLQVNSPSLALRLFLLTAQIASKCGSGFEDLAYDLYVQAFSVYEDSISESRAQLATIMLVIGTLLGAEVDVVDGYDTLSRWGQVAASGDGSACCESFMVAGGSGGRGGGRSWSS